MSELTIGEAEAAEAMRDAIAAEMRATALSMRAKAAGSTTVICNAAVLEQFADRVDAMRPARVLTGLEVRG